MVDGKEGRWGVGCLNQLLPVEFSSQSRNSAASPRKTAGYQKATCFSETGPAHFHMKKKLCQILSGIQRKTLVHV